MESEVDLPGRPIQHVIDSQAVAATQTAFAARRWIFRGLSQDYGIDAEVEFVSTTGAVTGATLRLQIKGRGVGHARKSLRIKKSTARYWLVSPVPVFVVFVNTVTGDIAIKEVDDAALDIDGSESRELSFPMSDAIPLQDSWGFLESRAMESQFALRDISSYALYNEAAQFVAWMHLFIKFDGDIAALMRWMRAEACDEVLAKDYGYYVALKHQCEEDPDLLRRLRLVCIDLQPHMEARLMEIELPSHSTPKAREAG